MLTNKSEIKFFALLGGALIFFLTASYLVGHKDIEKKKAIEVARTTPFANLTITAKSVYVYDAKLNQTIFAKNENQRLPLASLTKVMTALVASELAPPYSTVVITKSAVETSGDSGLLVGEHWLLQDLLDFSLVSSANDGVRAVALSLGALANSTTSPLVIETDFIHKMNAKADEIGMKNTYFLNDTGLDESISQGGAYGTARDMALLFSYILKNNSTLLSATREHSIVVTSLDNILHKAMNTDSVVGHIPGLLASKTGFTDLAGGNLVIALDPEIGHPIIISVLGSTEDGRFQDVLALVKASLESLKSSVLY